jgi:hypothetical protein
VLASIAAADAAGERLSAFQLIANVCVIGVPLLLADLLREQRRLLAQVRDQSGRLTQLRAAEAGEAAARERVRIARDVHDVVGNDLSAIAVQAGAGRALVHADPEEARATFERIAQMARDALAQTRAAVRGMRDERDDDAPGTPPGLADLDTLLDAIRAAGVDVRVLQRPPDDALTAVVRAAAFRIVQEALTNVARYARPPRAAVSIHLTNGEAFIDVKDDGARRDGAHRPRQRHRGHARTRRARRRPASMPAPAPTDSAGASTPCCPRREQVRPAQDPRDDGDPRAAGRRPGPRAPRTTHDPRSRSRHRDRGRGRGRRRSGRPGAPPADVVLMDIRMPRMDGIRSRAQAVVFAYEHGLARPGR